MKRFKLISGLLVTVALGVLIGVGIPRVGAQGPAPATGVAGKGYTGQVANLAAQNMSQFLDPVIYASGGQYRATCYVIETVADAASSTLPACNLIYTDNDTGNSHTVALTATNAANAVDTIGAGTTTLPWGTFHPKPSTAISMSTTSYASGTAATMTYSVHFRLEYIGK